MTAGQLRGEHPGRVLAGQLQDRQAGRVLANELRIESRWDRPCRAFNLRVHPPAPVAAALGEAQDAKPLLGWAMEQAQSSLGGASDTRIFPCRFGLCASQTFAVSSGKEVRLWLLASAYHVLLVSLHGAASGEEEALAGRCVESMHLVLATQYPN